MMQQYDKMILAILQGDDYHDAVHSLNEHGFYARCSIRAAVS